jgi:hypothetical protein
MAPIAGQALLSHRRISAFPFSPFSHHTTSPQGLDIQLGMESRRHSAGGDKTPTDSPINHSGLSPIPLTATPPLSRNPSRPPEPPRDQTPDDMPWDTGGLSNSPKSVRTPDVDPFEVEMLDSAVRNFYQPKARAETFRYYDEVAVLLMKWADESDELKTGPEVGCSLESTIVGSILSYGYRSKSCGLHFEIATGSMLP